MKNKIIKFSKNFNDKINKTLDTNLQNRLYGDIFNYNFLNKKELLSDSKFYKFRLSNFRILFSETEGKFLFIDIMNRKENYDKKVMNRLKEIVKNEK